MYIERRRDRERGGGEHLRILLCLHVSIASIYICVYANARAYLHLLDRFVILNCLITCLLAHLYHLLIARFSALCLAVELETPEPATHEALTPELKTEPLDPMPENP